MSPLAGPEAEAQAGQRPVHHRIANVAGWYGLAAIVIAYLLVSIDALDGHSVVYQLLNLTGALALIWVYWTRAVFQGVVLNLFWVAIAVVGLLQIS
ncbi:MAG: hypothetical protein FGM34_06670 [Solirubrobacteraceae bacterium]|nr:hypothetical protein [Solirubrobacteraceae bacterium]